MVGVSIDCFRAPDNRSGAASDPVHPPKIEVFDVAAMTNIDPKGIARAVDEYRTEPFGLYMARAAPGRAQFGYLESWLLPSLGLRVTDFWFHPGYERDQDFYLDVVRIDRSGQRWRTEDLYLDLVIRDGRNAEVLDTDELVAALCCGQIVAKTAQNALNTVYRTLDGVANYRYDLDAWLAGHDIRLSWKRRS